MFDIDSEHRALRTPQAGRTGQAGAAGADRSLAFLAERARAGVPSSARLVPVVPALGALLPDGALRRGQTVVVSGAGARGGAGGASRAGGAPEGVAAGAVSLMLALLAGPTAAGAWATVLGVPGLGATAARDLGVHLAHLVLVPDPGLLWPELAATLIDGVDIVAVRPTTPPSPVVARRMAARARDRRTVLIVLPGRSAWPEPPDVCLTVGPCRWEGIESGAGHLGRREVVVTTTGRRAGTGRRHTLWLPSSDGGVDPSASYPSDSYPSDSYPSDS